MRCSSLTYGSPPSAEEWLRCKTPVVEFSSGSRMRRGCCDDPPCPPPQQKSWHSLAVGFVPPSSRCVCATNPARRSKVWLINVADRGQCKPPSDASITGPRARPLYVISVTHLCLLRSKRCTGYWKAIAWPLVRKGYKSLLLSCWLRNPLYRYVTALRRMHAMPLPSKKRQQR